MSIDKEEVPKTNAVNYILEAAQAKTEKEEAKAVAVKPEEDFSVVFCIDISGSMGQTRASGTLNPMRNRLHASKGLSRLQCV